MPKILHLFFLFFPFFSFSLFSEEEFLLSVDPFANNLSTFHEYSPKKSFEENLLLTVGEMLHCKDLIIEKSQLYSLFKQAFSSMFFEDKAEFVIPSEYQISKNLLEEALAYYLFTGEITNFYGILHEESPSIDLVNQKLNREKCIFPKDGLSNSSLLKKQFSRNEILGEYLHHGGSLFVSYPATGIKKLSLNQKENFFQTLSQYKKNLLNNPLNCFKMNKEMVGATYLFQTRSGSYYCLSYSGTSSPLIETTDNSESYLYFGKASDKDIKERIDIIFDYLKENNGPDLRNKIFQH